jgi:hypothetical protein
LPLHGSAATRKTPGAKEEEWFGLFTSGLADIKIQCDVIVF